MIIKQIKSQLNSIHSSIAHLSCRKVEKKICLKKWKIFKNKYIS
jgi:hypothetical protein